jgi:ABC-2 type transport system ATP-binding protein
MTAIEVTDLTHRYGRHAALRGVSFTVPRGAVYALLGPNGAGKTTLLRCLAGLLHASSGSARLLGVAATALTYRHRMRIGYIAEGQPLPGALTLRQLEAYLAPLYDQWDVALADELRERFRLRPSQRIRSMSRGEQMKAAMLVSLAPRPELLLMDEPFTGMDALVKDELVRGLLGVAAGEGITILISSHDLAELETLADHVGFLDDGSMLLSHTMDAVRSRFRHVELLVQDTSAGVYVPDDVLSEERAGRRITFIHPRASDGTEAELRARNDGIAYVDVRPATLRELFVALARQRGGAARLEAGSTLAGSAQGMPGAGTA